MIKRNRNLFFFSSRRRHTRLQGDWSSDVCSSDLVDREKDRYYGADKSLSLMVDDQPATIDKIAICNLSDLGGGWAHTPQGKIAVDPVLGRIAFPPGQSPPLSPLPSLPS